MNRLQLHQTRLLSGGITRRAPSEPRKSIPGPSSSSRDVAEVLLGGDLSAHRARHVSKRFATDQQQSTQRLARHLRPLTGWGNKRRFVYVSTPITGGTRLYEFLAACGKKSKKELSAIELGTYHNKVIAANSRQAATVCERLREQGVTALNPSATDFPSWRQTEYNRNWTSLLSQVSLDAMVVCPGWQLSYGCLLEVRTALDHNIPVRDDRLRPLSRKTAQEQLDAAVSKARAQGFEIAEHLPRVLTAPLDSLPMEV